MRLLFLGESKTGKSSLILRCTGSEDRLPADKDERTKTPGVLNPVVLPIENKLEDYSTILIDSPGNITDEDPNVSNQVKSASAVIILYDMTDESSVTTIKEFWLPFVKKFNPRVPVIIVGNKLDLVKVNSNTSYFTRIGKILRPLMRSFEQVQMGIEVSVKENKNILEMLYLAQSSFIFPLSPLIHLAERTLTVKYKKALTRIFRILDIDNDGKLSDEELRSLQHRVFGNTLNAEDLKGLKDIVKEQAPAHYNSKFVNLEGFYAINKYLLELMKIKNSWLILKHFGYDKKIDLPAELFVHQLVMGPFVSVELKEEALKFIKRIFNKFAANGVLTREKLEKIFFPMESFPEADLKKYSSLAYRDSLTMAEWEMFWSHLTYADYSDAYKYLYYIGLEEKLTNVMFITNSKSNFRGLKQAITRNVLRVALVGDQRVGKSAIVKHFLDLPGDTMSEEPQKQTNIVAVDFPNGAFRQVIFTEVQTVELSESNKAVELDNSFDLVCICFDQPDSLQRFLHEKAQFLRHPVPRLAVYCKADEKPLDRKPLETRELEDLGLRVVAECSSKNRELSSFCQSVYRVLENPELGLRKEEVEFLTGANRFDLVSKYRLHIVGGIMASVLFIYAIKKFSKK